jgi:hypothetical protein
MHWRAENFKRTEESFSIIQSGLDPKFNVGAECQPATFFQRETFGKQVTYVTFLQTYEQFFDFGRKHGMRRIFPVKS